MKTPSLSHGLTPAPPTATMKRWIAPPPSSEDGADITFVEAPQSADEMRGIPAALKGTPQLVNLVVGGKTPILDLNELGEMGFSLVLYANVALQSAVYGMQQALGQLKDTGRMDEGGPVASFLERQRMVRKNMFDELEQRYAY